MLDHDPSRGKTINTLFGLKRLDIQPLRQQTIQSLVHEFVDSLNLWISSWYVCVDHSLKFHLRSGNLCC